MSKQQGGWNLNQKPSPSATFTVHTCPHLLSLIL